jgi:hypothetical protein
MIKAKFTWSPWCDIIKNIETIKQDAAVPKKTFSCNFFFFRRLIPLHLFTQVSLCWWKWLKLGGEKRVFCMLLPLQLCLTTAEENFSLNRWNLGLDYITFQTYLLPSHSFNENCYKFFTPSLRALNGNEVNVCEIYTSNDERSVRYHLVWEHNIYVVKVLNYPQYVKK